MVLNDFSKSKLSGLKKKVNQAETLSYLDTVKIYQTNFCRLKNKTDKFIRNKKHEYTYEYNPGGEGDIPR